MKKSWERLQILLYMKIMLQWFKPRFFFVQLKSRKWRGVFELRIPDQLCELWNYLALTYLSSVVTFCNCFFLMLLVHKCWATSMTCNAFSTQAILNWTKILHSIFSRCFFRILLRIQIFSFISMHTVFLFSSDFLFSTTHYHRFQY